jgi:hypothetical protein
MRFDRNLYQVNSQHLPVTLPNSDFDISMTKRLYYSGKLTCVRNSILGTSPRSLTFLPTGAINFGNHELENLLILAIKRIFISNRGVALQIYK